MKWFQKLPFHWFKQVSIRNYPAKTVDTARSLVQSWLNNRNCKRIWILLHVNLFKNENIAETHGAHSVSPCSVSANVDMCTYVCTSCWFHRYLEFLSIRTFSIQSFYQSTRIFISIIPFSPWRDAQATLQKVRGSLRKGRNTDRYWSLSSSGCHCEKRRTCSIWER